MKNMVDEFKLREQEFAEAVKGYGDITFATKDQDIKEHWDVKLGIKIDVKGMRKVKRSDDGYNENIHYVELKNVNGYGGWLYGKADMFAFETEDYYVLVFKGKLQDFIAEKCSAKEHSDVPELYKLYTRSGRKDLITLVKTIDLIYISDKIIKK